MKPLALFDSVIVASAAAALLAAPSALAWQSAKVGPNGATLFTQPSSGSASAGLLRAGTPVNLSDRPTRGYYRCSAAGGLTGWISTDDVTGLRSIGASHPSSPTSTSSPSSSSDSGAERAFSVSGFAGLGIAGGSAGFAFGAEGGYRFSPNLGIGLFFTYQTIASASGSSTTSSGTASGSASASLMSFAGEFNYFFGGPLSGLHLGGKAGFGIFSVSGSGTATTTSGVSVNVSSASVGGFGLLFGGGGGYDYPIGPPGLSVGGDAEFMLSTSGTGTLIDLLASVKYAF
jgi:hypothetical protein